MSKRNTLLWAILLVFSMAAGVDAADSPKKKSMDEEAASASEKPARSRKRAPSALEKSKTLMRRGASTEASSKSEQFLEAIQRARTLEDVERASQKANFSPSEMKKLDATLARPPYSTKLKTLRDQSLAQEVAKSNSKIKAQTKKLSSQKKQQLAKKQREELSRLDQATLATVQRARVEVERGDDNVVIRSLTDPMRRTFRAARSYGGADPEDAPQIDRIDPDPVSPGARITILGRNFGASRGTGSVTLMMEEGYILCPITTWRDGYIDATIPSYLTSVIGEEELSVDVWVRPNEGVGDTEAIRLVAEVEILPPEITMTSPDQLMPGQLLVIVGSNFMSSRGHVRFVMNPTGRTLEGTIDEWEDTYITARLPDDLEGFAAGDRQVTVEVETSHGDEVQASTPIDLQPLLDTEVLSALRAYSRREDTEPNHSQVVVFDHPLLNDYTVVDSRVELVSAMSRGGRASCSFWDQPSVGADSARAVISLGTGDPGHGHGSSASVTCGTYVTVEGPRGLPSH